MAAGAIALLARRAGSLSAGGAAAAVVAGTVAVAAGWDWGALLILFFVAGSAASRVGGPAKAARLGDVVVKQGARDAGQVLANGGAFVAAALLFLLRPSPLAMALGAGALAAAAADTFSTELGALSRTPPRSILTGRPVLPGMSGGVTLLGTAASVLGAALLAAGALLLGWPVRVALAALAGGVAGALLDSLLGAAVQQRRHCPACGRATERAVHGCGTATLPAGGVAWIDNDAVNLLATIGGALVAVLLAW